MEGEGFFGFRNTGSDCKASDELYLRSILDLNLESAAFVLNFSHVIAVHIAVFTTFCTWKLVDRRWRYPPLFIEQIDF